MISLVYDEDEQGNRRECAGTSDEIARWLPAFPELEELWLAGSQATDEAMVFVGQLHRLKELWMWNAQVSDEGVAKLKDLKELRCIHINDAGIGDRSLAVLAKLPRLEKLSLQRNDFTDAGLAELKGMTQLKELWIGLGTERFTGAGLASLSNLVNLEVLELGRMPIDEEALKPLHRLTKLRELIGRGRTLNRIEFRRAVQAGAEDSSHGSVFDELGLPFPTLEVVAGWNDETRVVPNPIAILSAWRRTEDYGDWLGKRDVRTFTHTNRAGYQFEIHALALARSDGHLGETLASFGIRRPNGSMLASVPQGGSGDWAQWAYDVYNEDGRNEVARVSVTIDAHGKSRVSRVVWNPESPDKLEWEVNPLGVAWSELEWSEAEKKWEQRQFVRELGHAPYRKTESAPSVFGPIREVTLHDWDVQHEALDFETGRILVIPDEAREQLLAHNPDWFANTGVDLMTDTTRKGVGLLTLLTNELRLVKLAAEEWDSLTPAQLSEALSRGASGLTEVHLMLIGKVYVLQTNTPLPLTLGFRTGSGTEGVLQLIRFGEGSQPPVTLRYKLVQSGSFPFIAPAAPKPAALLQFRWIAEDRSTAPTELWPDPNNRSGQTQLRLLREVFLDDAAVATATVGTNELGNAEITLHLTDEGARTLARVTDQKNGRRFAIVHQGRILIAPMVKGMLVGRELKIVGNFSAAEASRIVTALNQGRLPSHSAFGPVIERLVPLAFPETTNWFLDLETGTMSMPPPEFADAVTGRNDLLYWDNLTVIRKEQFAEWAKATGADLFVRSQESLETIGGIWALAQGPTPGRWDDLDALTLTQLEAAITTIETSRKDSERMERFGLGPRGMLHPRQSVNYFFKTRDGTLGVLQLAGTSDNPRGVKIRYKLVHDEGGNK